MTVHDLDPLASPTLAALYLRQGHLPRAASVADTLLTKNPEDGVALALRHRIRWLTTLGLEAWIQRGELALRLAGTHDEPLTLHVEFFPSRSFGAYRVCQPWTSTRGSVRLPLPGPRGAAVAKLTSQRDQRAVLVAISRVVSW
ncbi:MAG: hypothetical protein ACPHRO_04135 [Nannocystaceae bacterium]